MTTENPTNLPASVRARLKNKAGEIGLDFNQVLQLLQYYAMERFLYRLSKTKWADRLIVKGAAMLRVWDGAVARPTRDKRHRLSWAHGELTGGRRRDGARVPRRRVG